MILYPAIDLKDGRCVRLEQGDMARATVFNDDPGAQAAHFAALGARFLHVVDLNGAFAGRPVNAAAVDAIVRAAPIPIQLGGGIRTLATIEDWLGRGVARVILGTAALRDPDLVITACRRFPGCVAVGIDARAGRVAVAGWAEISEVAAADLAGRFADAGVAAIVFTNIERDGVLTGPDIDGTLAIAAAVPGLPVIASGGVASLADLVALKTRGAGRLAGVISGRALYDGRIDLAAALALFAGDDGERSAAPC
jgi:phosphoribosylformimino-5-aminoimidazole carboxamide ribotide isomerase